MALSQLDRLQSQLLTSGIQQTNQPLYQVINQLITYLRTTAGLATAAVNSGSSGGGGGSPSGIILSNGGMSVDDGVDGCCEGGLTIIQNLPPVTGGMNIIQAGIMPVEREPDVYATTPVGNIYPGRWIDNPFNAADYTANGAMTWTVASGNVIANRYAIYGNYDGAKLLFWDVCIVTSTVGGVLNNELRIATPAGLTIGAGFNGATGYRVVQGATDEMGLVFAAAPNAFVAFRRPGSVNFAASAGTTTIQALVWFQIT